MNRVWFDRSFTLGLRPESLAGIVERLRGTAARLEVCVSRVSGTTLTERGGDSWSIQEHVGHLADLEPLWLGRIDDLAGGLERLRPADLENTATWDANHNERPLQSILADFRRRRTEIVERVESMGVEQVAATALHPGLEQAMTVVDLCYFVAEHDDHHLATLAELRGASDE